MYVCMYIYDNMPYIILYDIYIHKQKNIRESLYDLKLGRHRSVRGSAKHSWLQYAREKE